jgi:hypothetical protein
MDELMLLRSILEEQKSWNNLKKSPLIMFYDFLMKYPLKASGLEHDRR